jgi:hypothetical protein
MQLKVDPEIQQMLLQWVGECRKAGTALTFVYCPEHVLGQRYVSNRSEILEVFRTVAQQNEIRFLDYSNMAICQDTSYFYNASHLNRQGSLIFSAQLAHDLQSK